MSEIVYESIILTQDAMR